MSNYSEKSNGDNFNRRSSASPVQQRQKRRSRSPTSRSRQSRSRSPAYDYHTKRNQQHSTVSHRYTNRSRSRSPLGPSNYYSAMQNRPPMYKSRNENDLIRLNAPENNVLAIFGLSKRVIEQDLFDLYKNLGCKECKVIMDKHTGFPKGYGFVYFSRTKDAIIARDKTNGNLLFGKPMRVDFSIGERDYSALAPTIPAPMFRHRLFSNRDSRDIRDFRDSRVSHRYAMPIAATRDLRMPRESFGSYYQNHHRSHYLRAGSPMRDSSRRDNMSPYHDHGYLSRHRGETGRGRIATPPLPSNGYQRDSMPDNYRSHYGNDRSRSRTPERSRKHYRQARDLNQDTRIFSNRS